MDTNIFGFTGPEIFPLDSQVESLHVADIDGDGLKDIIVANNSRSKINILYNQTGKTNLYEKRQALGQDRDQRTAARRPVSRIAESIASEETHFLDGGGRFER